jgi:geranylgeranyl reductase
VGRSDGDFLAEEASQQIKAQAKGKESKESKEKAGVN